MDEAENLSYEDGGITEQTGMAERGLEVFHAGFTNLDPGWQGSVTKQRPNHPIPDGRGPKSVKTPVRIFAKEQYSTAHANGTFRAPKHMLLLRLEIYLSGGLLRSPDSTFVYLSRFS